MLLAYKGDAMKWITIGVKSKCGTFTILPKKWCTTVILYRTDGMVEINEFFHVITAMRAAERIKRQEKQQKPPK